MSDITETLQLLRAACKEHGLVVSGDLRVSEKDAARLLAHSPEYLKRMRNEGRGPAVYGRGMNGCRVSYRLTDLASWIDSKRQDY